MLARPNSSLRRAGAFGGFTLAVAVALAADGPPGTPAFKERTKVFDGVEFLTPSSTVYENKPAERKPQTWVFFPPAPPPLGTELRELPPFASGRPPPAGMEAFVGELFYPALALRIAANDLPPAFADRLQAYRLAKNSLVTELHAVLMEARLLEPSARAARIADCARTEQPLLEELERRAEKLRLDLQGSDLLGHAAYSVDWELSESWASPASPATAARDARALRGAAFFQDGLPASQRRLLLDRALEIDARGEPAKKNGTPEAADWPVGFSPATARLRFVSNLPAPLAGRLSAYVTRKSAQTDALVAALRSALRGDSASRASLLRQFSEQQAPVLEQLEADAERIRLDLAAQPDPPGPPAPPSLPADLAARITQYHQRKVEVLQTLYTTLARGRTGTDDAPATSPAAPDRTPDWLRRGGPATPVPPQVLRVSVDEFNQLQLDLIGGLNRELGALRLALADYARKGGRKSVDDLLRDFERARQEQETWERYRDYQAAMLQPGLSPAQRRLLFDAALQELRLPLPAAENID